LTPKHFKYFSLQTEKKTRLERFAIRPILISPLLQFNKENIVYGSYYFLGHKNQKSACSYCILLKMKFSNNSALNYNINIGNNNNFYFSLNILRLVLNEGLFHASLVGKKTH
jgi:hypothetical protein